jgi:hypothetical protein
VECRALEGVDMALPLPWHAAEFIVPAVSLGFVLVGVVFGLQDDSPSCGKDTAVDVELIRFEKEAAEDWQDG